MYFQEHLLSLLPVLALAIPHLANGVPSPSGLSKRVVEPWIAAFSDIGCHTLASSHHRIITPEGCLVWNSTQPGLYFGVNFGSGDDQRTGLQLFLDKECGDSGPHPLFAGDGSHQPGNYLQRAPKGMYSGGAPEGICFDGVHRSWPVATNGQAFMSLKPDNGPPM